MKVFSRYDCAVLPTGALERPVVMQGRDKKRARGVEDDPRESSPENREQAALLLSTKLCLCSPFQGTPGVLALIRCAQNALWCHLFKHIEPLANRDKPLFIKPLILAALMTTWLALKGALKSFIGMGGGNLCREGHDSRSPRVSWEWKERRGEGLCHPGG